MHGFVPDTLLLGKSTSLPRCETVSCARMVLVVAHCDKKATLIRAAKIIPPTGGVAY
jgi:hypothetical protein